MKGTFGENVAFALTDSGQVFAFGILSIWNDRLCLITPTRWQQLDLE